MSEIFNKKNMQACVLIQQLCKGRFPRCDYEGEKNHITFYLNGYPSASNYYYFFKK